MRATLLSFVASIILFGATTLAAQSIQSLYSDLESSKCKTLESQEEGSYALQQCPGIAGYKLLVEDFDLRQTVTVVKPDGTKHPLNFGGVIHPGFSSLGPKAEWRVKNEKRKVVPIALIVRFNASENPEDSSKITSYLVVSKITPAKICVTDKIQPGPSANEEARRAADSAAGKPCLEAR
jgi:hypothetical protein